MKYLIFGLLMYVTHLSAMNQQEVNSKQFQEWLKNACGVTNFNQFLANGDNDGKYPYCWAAVKAMKAANQQNEGKNQ